ncbi:hypothetical protein NEHOM01_0795 [Nematocida homosporus]|uniref:uncharacterized protein n=1 Tax=Nematocida homosporus TaxID=1912981 RepID=UPI00221E563C|nr:uncharacterized protein NEHOM01_0795 [Nematocida homosporus]KAI5185380.1 hypothetical protein NEHOM01_0795 [Nematocida homosporus]
MSFVKEVAGILEKEFPLERAEQSWDNVGILLEFTDKERKALLCIDLTHEVLNECEELGIKCVISYHPVIFTPVKKINTSTPLLYRCINLGMSVYSPHTALDGASNGINAWLGGLLTGTELVDTFGFIQVFKNKLTIQEILKQLTTHLSLTCTRYALSDRHNLSTIPEIIATSAGSGARPLKRLVDEGDPPRRDKPTSLALAITGEASHHDILALNRAGVSLIILEHTRSERGFLKCLQSILNANLSGDFPISQKDKDPIEFFLAQ